MNAPTLAQALRSAVARLTMHSSARLDAELLLAQALGRSRSYLHAWPERVLTSTEMQQFEELLLRRVSGEPMAHILGQREFWSLEFEVTPDTLIPRPDTELLVELALARIPPDAEWDILDLGTGSGAVALALAHERPRCQVLASDVSSAALAVAARNAQRFGLRNVRFGQGSWFEPVADQRFQMIVSNPPYVRDDDPHLSEGDVRYDPRSALVAGPEGLDALRLIVSGAPAHLRPGGWLLVEHGYDQGPHVRSMFEGTGFTTAGTAHDFGEQPRVTYGQWSLTDRSR